MEHSRDFAGSGTSEPGVVAASVYHGGRAVADISIEEAGDWARRDGHLVWIGLLEPSRELLVRIQHQFEIHDLAIEDAEHPHGYPKVEQYGDALFVVARTAQLEKGRVAFGETQLFVGKGFVVSVRHGASTPYKAVRDRLESCPTVLAEGEDLILYSILDFIVDQYMPVLDAIHREVEVIEDSVLDSQLNKAEIERLYTLRRDLMKLRYAAGPLVEVCRRLAGMNLPHISPGIQSHFRDVADHIHVVEERIDALREVLAFAFEASLLMGQEQASGVTKKLAAWAAILAVPTAIAGVYGMNFEHMPELRSAYGYYLVVGSMITICTLLYWRFRKIGWL